MSAPSQETANNPPTSTTKQSFPQRLASNLNLRYFVTLFFYLKVATIIMEFCGAISVSVRYDTWSSARYYNFVAVTGIVIAVIVIILSLFNVMEKFDKLPWMFIEMVFDFLWAILMLIASAIVTDLAKKYDAMDSFAAAAFFGFATTVLYLVDGGLRLINLLRGGSGIRIVRSPATNNPQQQQPNQTNTQPNY